jgi:hypothetical protein
MVKGVAKNESSVGDSRGGGDGEEELAEPEVRDNKQGFARYHALEVRVMKSSRFNDAGELVGGRLDASRYIPLSKKVSVRDSRVADIGVASAAKGIPQSSITSPEGSKR